MQYWCKSLMVSFPGLTRESRLSPLVKDFTRSTHLVWDGTEEYGMVLAEGVYFVVLEGNNEHLTEKLGLGKIDWRKR